jgi:hypothetical protein
MEKLRKVTFGELAEIADTHIETIRGHIKRGVLPFENQRGWARFDAIEVLYIASYYKALRLVKHHSMAHRTAEFISDSFENFAKRPPHEIKRSGQLEGQYLILYFIPNEGDLPFVKHEWCNGLEHLQSSLKHYVERTSYHEAAAFSVVNTGTISDWVIDRLFDLQGIEGDAAQGAKK